MGVQVITIVSARLCELSAVSQKVVASRWRHFRTIYDVCMGSIVVLLSTQQYKSYVIVVYMRQSSLTNYYVIVVLYDYFN